MVARNKKALTLFGDPKHLHPRVLRSLKIGGVDIGEAMVLQPHLKNQTDLLDLLNRSKDGSSVQSILLLLRRSFYGEMARNDFEGFCTSAASVKATREAIRIHLGPRCTEKVVRRNHDGEKIYFVLDWKRLRTDSTDVVKMSLKQWLQAIGFLVSYGWEMGVSEGRIDEKESLDAIKAMGLKRRGKDGVLSLAAYVRFIAKSYQIDIPKALELVSAHFPIDPGTMKVYRSGEWKKREYERRQTKKKSRSRKI